MLMVKGLVTFSLVFLIESSAIESGRGDKFLIADKMSMKKKAIYSETTKKITIIKKCPTKLPVGKKCVIVKKKTTKSIRPAYEAFGIRPSLLMMSDPISNNTSMVTQAINTTIGTTTTSTNIPSTSPTFQTIKPIVSPNVASSLSLPAINLPSLNLGMISSSSSTTSRPGGASFIAPSIQIPSIGSVNVSGLITTLKPSIGAFIGPLVLLPMSTSNDSIKSTTIRVNAATLPLAVAPLLPMPAILKTTTTNPPISSVETSTASSISQATTFTTSTRTTGKVSSNSAATSKVYSMSTPFLVSFPSSTPSPIKIISQYTTHAIYPSRKNLIRQRKRNRRLKAYMRNLKANNLKKQTTSKLKNQ